MAVELRDFRGRISVETDSVLEAKSRARGKEKAELLREVMHEWALREIHEATLTLRLLPTKGREGNAGD